MADDKTKEKGAAPAKPSPPKAAAPAKSEAAAKDAGDKSAKKKVKKEEATYAAYSDTEGDRSSISVPILSTKDAKEVRKVHLPLVFEEPLRTDLIAKAVQAARANRRQPYGAPAEGVWAGRRHSTEWSGKGHGISRVQRLKQGNGAATSPNNVGGARAHPPRAAANRDEKINIKERRKARRSALAATAREELVRARGHQFEDGLKLPVIVDHEFETLFRRAQKSGEGEERTGPTRALHTALENLGLGADLRRARAGTHVRAGRGKTRGRRFRVPRSILIVASNYKEIGHCARNLPGVTVVSPRGISTEALAPGGAPGRLTLITETALLEFKGMR
jgi:large subunit ribosomal protein L4e